MIASGAASPVELSGVPPIVSVIPVLTCGCAWAIPPLMRAGQARPFRAARTRLCAPSPQPETLRGRKSTQWQETNLGI
jgi:hypothetical protein